MKATTRAVVLHTLSGFVSNLMFAGMLCGIAWAADLHRPSFWRLFVIVSFVGSLIAQVGRCFRDSQAGQLRESIAKAKKEEAEAEGRDAFSDLVSELRKRAAASEKAKDGAR